MSMNASSTNRFLVTLAFLSALLFPATLKAEMIDGVEVSPLALEQLPNHARAVILTVIGRSRNGDPAALQRELRVGNSGLLKPEEGFRYQGFGVREVHVTALSQMPDDPEQHHISGNLLWKDFLGRRTILSFEALYRVGAEAITLEQAGWAPKYSIQPRVQAFAIPARRGAELAEAAKSSFGDFFLAASDASAQFDAGSEDTIIAVFFMDRMDPEIACELLLSDEARGTDGEDDITRSRGYEPGWGVAGTSLTTAAYQADDTQYLKVVCEADDDDLYGGDDERLIAVLPLRR